MLNTQLYQATICAWEARGAEHEHAAIKLCFPDDIKGQGRKLIEAYCKPAQIPYRAINVVGERANSKYFEVYFSPHVLNNTLQLNSLKDDQAKLSDPDKIVSLPIATLSPRNDDSIQFGLDLENMLKAMHDLAIFEVVSVKYSNNHLATVLNVLRKGESPISKDAISYKPTETPALINTHEFSDLTNKQTAANIYKSALKIQHSFITRSDLRAVFKPLESSSKLRGSESIKKFINKLRKIKLFFQEKTINFLTLMKQKIKYMSLPKIITPQLFKAKKQDIQPEPMKYSSNQRFSSLLTKPIKTPKIFSAELPKQEDLSTVTACLYGKDQHNKYNSASITLCFPVNHKSTELQQKYLKHLPHVITKKTFISSTTKKPVIRKYYEIYFMVEQVNNNTFLCGSREKSVTKPDLIIDLPLSLDTKDKKSNTTQSGLDVEQILQQMVKLKPRSSGFFKYTKGNVISMMIDILNTEIISPAEKVVGRLLHNQHGK